MRSRRPQENRRGTVAVLTLVLLTVLLGFAALTVDIGAAYNTRSDLQNAADAAALAAAAAYTSDSMMAVRLNEGGDFFSVMSDGTIEATQFAMQNPSLGTMTTALEEADVAFGWLDQTSSNSGLVSAVDASGYNAVQVTARRTSDSTNGPVSAMFSAVFGNDVMEIRATATASFDDRVSGFDTNDSSGLVPFSVHEDVYNAYLAGNHDNYTYNPDSDSISGSSDGIPEINLFPHVNVPGNFGLLNIGTNNQGVPALSSHIENGVPPEDFDAETGSEVLTFWANDAPQTYVITGDPGIKVALESSVETRVGQLVGYFLHNSVTEQGANAEYTITRIVFGRVMDARFSGNPHNRGLFIQPASYVGGGVVLSVDAPSSGGNSGRLVLSR